MADMGERLAYQIPNLVPAEDLLYDGDTGQIMKWNEAKLGPRPSSISSYMSSTESLEIPIAKQNKQRELEAAFQAVWDREFGTQMAVGLVLYMEFTTDPRTVNVKAARTNFINKTTALNDLGRPGKPALTIANINAIVW